MQNVYKIPFIKLKNIQTVEKLLSFSKEKKHKHWKRTTKLRKNFTRNGSHFLTDKKRKSNNF